MNSSQATRAVFKLAWAKWKRIAAWLGKWNTRILLTLTYFVVLGPMALVLQLLRRDLLGRRRRPGESFWKEIDTGEPTLEGSRFQS